MSLTPVLIIHGGAGAREGRHARFDDYDKRLRRIAAAGYAALLSSGARAAVCDALKRLEDDPLFNAGTGSRLQRDGQARMSAALMDSEARRFAGVINVERVRYPSELAERLNGERHSVLAGGHAADYARRHGMADYDPITEHRRCEHQRRLAGSHGTVGAVAVDASGLICAGTSTGGIGFETPGRVSDSATVAGTYASPGLGVSCTGRGEQIVNHAVAARLVTRVDDGMPTAAALEKTLAEAGALGYEYGLIAVDRDGRWQARQTANVTTLFAATDDGRHVVTFLDQPPA